MILMRSDYKDIKQALIGDEENPSGMRKEIQDIKDLIKQEGKSQKQSFKAKLPQIKNNQGMKSTIMSKRPSIKE